MNKRVLWIIGGALLLVVVGMGIWWFLPRNGKISALAEKRQAFGEEILGASASTMLPSSVEYSWEFRERGIIFIQSERKENANQSIVTYVTYARISAADATMLRGFKAKAPSSKYYGCPDSLLSKDSEVFAENTCLNSRSPVGLTFDGCSIQVSCHDFFELDTTAKEIGKELQSLLFWKRLHKLELPLFNE